MILLMMIGYFSVLGWSIAVVGGGRVDRLPDYTIRDEWKGFRPEVLTVVSSGPYIVFPAILFFILTMPFLIIIPLGAIVSKMSFSLR